MAGCMVPRVKRKLLNGFSQHLLLSPISLVRIFAPELPTGTVQLQATGNLGKIGSSLFSESTKQSLGLLIQSVVTTKKKGKAEQQAFVGTQGAAGRSREAFASTRGLAQPCQVTSRYNPEPWPHL